MPNYVTLINDLDRGISNMSKTLENAESFVKLAETMGIKVKDIYWTQGQFDGLAIINAPDSDTVLALMMKYGNVHAHTMRAYSPDEIRDIIKRL